ncbi:MAG: glycosyltransferase family 4 protein [Chloroflexi bacterium]|nr:glycosyltransferase family 4 protein [Chloroflexota bacterium]
MRILFVADGRSPTALSWMEYFVKAGHEVHLASSFDCNPTLEFTSVHFVPVAFSTAATANPTNRSGLRKNLPTALRTRLRNWVGPFTLLNASRKLRAVINRVQPDLIHAMRIPYEGMLAAGVKSSAPLVISVWGNDFTLHALSNPFMGAATRRAMRRADALHSDTQRDLRLAQLYGFSNSKPSLVIPGNGGIHSDIFYPLPDDADEGKTVARLRVINPRGLRAYVRNDVFFQAIPRVLAHRPEVRFYCPSMEGEPEAKRWVERMRIGDYVSLMPKLSPRALADSYHAAQVMVSPSTHDGTPNSLLEAMACSVFPICGDLESIREWITSGENGLLVDPTDPKALADAIVWALKDSKMRKRAAKINAQIVAERADYEKNMGKAENFYQEILSK